MEIINKNIIFTNLTHIFCCLPAIKKNNLDIAQNIKNTQKSSSDIAQTILKQTGITERRYAHANEAASDLAIKAIANSSLDSSKIETLIVATTSGDYPSPATAHFVHAGLNLNSHVHCFDVASSCSSFISAMRCAIGIVNTSTSTLIIASEVKHKGLNITDMRTTSLFGDGAGGIFLNKIDESKNSKDFFEFCHQESLSNISKNIYIPVGGSKEPINQDNLHRNKLEFQNPKITYLQIIKSITEAILCSWQKREQLLKECFNETNSIIPGFIFIHQANKNILKEVINKLPEEIAKRIPILMADTGNMVCASLPVLRARILFLKSLHYHFKKNIPKNNLISEFKLACEKENIFSYTKKENGVLFSTQFEYEKIDIFDDGSVSLNDSWLSKIFEEEWDNLQNIFENELNSSNNYEIKKLKRIDLWVTAGGGFQTIAMLHGKVI
ncbi:3-oxoacyl-ACP synthase III family protein [Silvanigrella aquatica]|uniref:Beta-ketoacyl-[acyl-carrier-protein] synthase III N-terminal domain-containing protein n=1 Tax=Silvanigrella aquatica TaxID=1915309 RepID=A0A1L4D383_9BACT|nr:hypothetical protein [Silvanigrella aquatica]APJ04666.1 hypothetical protein AXG55_12435 [Silvanigrella aquatica]